jgi:hypothetical protein
MTANLAALCYLVAASLFILALRGLSNPETSQRGNLFGMIGMAIAIAPPPPPPPPPPRRSACIRRRATPHGVWSHSAWRWAAAPVP